MMRFPPKSRRALIDEARAEAARIIAAAREAAEAEAGAAAQRAKEALRDQVAHLPLPVQKRFSAGNRRPGTRRTAWQT